MPETGSHGTCGAGNGSLDWAAPDSLRVIPPEPFVTSVVRSTVMLAEMLRLRARPQDLPARDGIVAGSVIAVVGASMLSVHALYAPGRALLRVVVDVLIEAAFVFGALRVTGRMERYRQTFSALCGTGALLALLTWPLVDIVVERPPGSALAALAMLLLLAIYAWSTLVIGHILRHALELSLARAVALALAYVVVSSLLGDALVPPLTGMAP